jgi:hypothetical protein
MYVEPAEMDLFFFFNNQAGSFKSALFTAIFKADAINKSLLSTIYPDEVKAVHRYQTEDNYWSDLQSRVKDM